MTSYTFLLVLAIILLSTKVLGLASGKVKMPQVVGALVAGLILGPSVLNLVVEDSFISVISEIGVIMLMFAAGLETDLQELKKTGLASFVIACAGVVVPLLGGTALYLVFFNGEGDAQHMLKAIFVGVILTAMSALRRSISSLSSFISERIMACISLSLFSPSNSFFVKEIKK